MTAVDGVVVRSGSSTDSSSVLITGRPGATVRPSVSHCLDDLSGRPRQQVLADERVELTVEDGLRVPCLVSGSRILDQLVRVEDVGADRLAAEAGVGRTSPLFRQ